MTEATQVHDNSITSASLRSEAAAQLPLLSCSEPLSGARVSRWDGEGEQAEVGGE